LTEIEQLKLTDGMVWICARHGLSAEAAKLFLLRQFHGRENFEEFFKTNIANSVVFNAIDALIAQSVIATYQEIQNSIKVWGTFNFDIVGLDELKCHRTYNAHPGVVDWDRKYMKDFIKNELQYKDIKAVRLFQVRQSIVNRMLALGCKSDFENGAFPSRGIVSMIKTSLELSLKDNKLVPPNLSERVVQFFADFNKQIQLLANLS
jgi:hypothetical protein